MSTTRPRVSGADIHGAKYYGVVVEGATVNVTGSKVHEIGDIPFNGTQHGRAILYINGASGTISGNQVYDFQKNGIEVSGLAADGVALSSRKTSATVKNNVVTGEGPIDYIAQNGIVIRNGASATVAKNTVSGFDYTPDVHRGLWPAALSGRPRQRPEQQLLQQRGEHLLRLSGRHDRRTRQVLVPLSEQRPGSPQGGSGLLVSERRTKLGETDRRSGQELIACGSRPVEINQGPAQAGALLC